MRGPPNLLLTPYISCQTAGRRAVCGCYARQRDGLFGAPTTQISCVSVAVRSYQDYQTGEPHTLGVFTLGIRNPQSYYRRLITGAFRTLVTDRIYPDIDLHRMFVLLFDRISRIQF